MKILIDTREQNLLEFKHPYISEVKRQKLDVGDIACEFEDGYIPPFVFERKSVADLYGTLGQGYKRFKREIMRAKKSDTQLFIIIEGTLSKVLQGSKHSTLEGVSVVYKIFTLWIRYGLHPIFCKDRTEMSLFIVNFYIAIGKEQRRKKKASPNTDTAPAELSSSGQVD